MRGLPEFTVDNANEAVDRGVAWLDEHCPDWAQKIDLIELNLRSPWVCMLGQTADCIVKHAPDMVSDYDVSDYDVSDYDVWDTLGGYFVVLGRFGLDERWASSHGFNLPGSILTERGTAYVRGSYEILTYVWKDRVLNRRERVRA